MSSLSDNKKKLREEYRRRRDSFFDTLDAATRGLAFRRPPTPLAQLIKSSQVVALYRNVGSEAPTGRLAEYCGEIGKTVAFPCVRSDQPLDFRAVSHLDLLVEGFANIPEPSNDDPLVEPDLIITPLVAFDRQLNRLGQGGGHYDRTFEEYPEVPRIGLAWSVQETENIPVEPHDIPLQMIVTECEIIE